MALTDKLTSIAAAIREKGGTTEKLTLDAMPTAIAALPTGGGEGGEDLVPNPIVLSGKLTHAFSGDKFKWVLENYGDRITTQNISNIDYMLSDTTYNGEIKFVLNPPTNSSYLRINANYAFCNSACILPDNFFSNVSGLISNVGHIFDQYKGKTTPPFTTYTGSYNSGSGYMFNMAQCETIGDITFSPDSFQQMFYQCPYLKEIPKMTLVGSRWQTYNYSNNSKMFFGCVSLRTIPQDLLKVLYNTSSTTSYCFYNYMFGNCYALDEIVGISPKTSTLTSNVFLSTFDKCYHLQRIVFETQEDGTPYTANWKGQTIDLSKYVGWAGESYADKSITSWNTGITYEKEVGTGKGKYADLKDDPDWWSREFGFSRFGHDAAVELINSLPDTEDYLVSQNASNNIVKFYTNAGMYIDGGGVSNLTEEEIAVAVAKGWTISYTTA